MANFEAFLESNKLSANLLFLKSGLHAAMLDKIFLCIMCVVGTKLYSTIIIVSCFADSLKVDEILTKKMFCATPLFSDENSTFINHHQTM